MTDMNLDQIRTHLEHLSREAGALILAVTPSSLQITSKKNSSVTSSPTSHQPPSNNPPTAADIATQTDRAVESLISTRLAAHFPTFPFIGEESYTSGTTLTSAPTFVVDPIDGTSNFVHGFPEVSVSIALVVDKRPVVGVVYNPFRRELWSAARGHGAVYVRDDDEAQTLPLTSAPLCGLEPACVGVEWGSDRSGPNFEMNVKVFTRLLRTAGDGGSFVNSLRCTGSAALAICRVAAGQQDAFWECGCWAWDVAGAWCVLVEAGGVMVDGHPGEWNPGVENRRYLAVRPACEGQWEFVEEFWAVVGDERSTYGPPCL